MIPAPQRIGPPSRNAAVVKPAAAEVADGTGADAQDEPDATPLGSVAMLDARITALVARASTPQDEALEKQREEFDYIARVQAESEREINALRDMAMEQIKQDDELLKKWIALI